MPGKTIVMVLLCHSSECVDALCVLLDCALGISPVISYSGVKENTGIQSPIIITLLDSLM